MRVPTTKFQNAFGKYLKQVIANNEVIITKNGKAVAKLIKYEDPILHMMKEGAAEYSVRKRVTYEEFLEISANSEARYELIDGEMRLMASPKHRHQVAVREIFVRLYNWFQDKPCNPLTSPFDVKLYNESECFEDDPNVVQPDILVICDEEQIDDNDNYQGIPALVVEILSPSTKSWDMIKKLNLYMLSGVREYWIVNTVERCVFVYAFTDRKIQTLKMFELGERVKSVAFDGFEVDVNLIFS
jgi:prevent-host-death family protein